MDGTLLLAARTRPEDFGRFYDRNFSLVLGYFFRRTACVDVAADLTAETFTAALDGVPRYRPSLGTGRGWLFGIAGNLYRQWVRRGVIESRARMRLGVATPPFDTADLEEVDRLIDLRPLVDALPDALDALSPALRDAIMLRVSEELPYAEIAHRLGCSEISARVRVSRGLDQLHRELAVP